MKKMIVFLTAATLVLLGGRAALADDYEGCTPGFWQGGSAGGYAGGRWLWNEISDPDWVGFGGNAFNPYITETSFCTFFGCGVTGDMHYFLNPKVWAAKDDFHKAARSLVAAYLNASWGMFYPYSTAQLDAMWDDAVASGDFMSLHLLLDAANGEHLCPISAGGY